MTILVNGENASLPENVKSISDLLQFYHLDEKLIIVELNKEIVDKQLYKQTEIGDGDQLELVKFVGGG